MFITVTADVIIRYPVASTLNEATKYCIHCLVSQTPHDFLNFLMGSKEKRGGSLSYIVNGEGKKRVASFIETFGQTVVVYLI